MLDLRFLLCGHPYLVSECLVVVNHLSVVTVLSKLLLISRRCLNSPLNCKSIFSRPSEFKMSSCQAWPDCPLQMLNCRCMDNSLHRLCVIALLFCWKLPLRFALGDIIGSSTMRLERGCCPVRSLSCVLQR